MKPKHDYRCLACGDIIPDYVGHLSSCLSCGGEVETFYGNWDNMLLAGNGRTKSDRYDSQGNIKAFGVFDDPLCLMVTGLQDDGGAGFNNALDPAQREYLAGKVMAGESGPKVRKEILKEYTKATGGNKEVIDP